MLLVDKLVEEKAVLARQVAERDATIARLQAVLATLEGTIATLQSSLINHANEAELLRRRLYGTKSERGGTNELQLLLGKILDDKAELTAKLDELVGESAAGGDGEKPSDAGPGDTPAGPPTRPERTTKPTGRRDLSKSKLARMVVTVDDPVSAARGRLIDYEESYQLMRVRAETKCCRAHWLMVPACRSRPLFDGFHAARRPFSIDDTEWAIRRGGG